MSAMGWPRKRTCVYSIGFILIFIAAAFVFRNLSPNWDDQPEALPWWEFRRSSRAEPQGEPPSVTCLIVTSPGHHEDRARHLGAPWQEPYLPTPCPNTLYLSSESHPDLANVLISKHSSYEDLWGKVLEGFRAVNPSSTHWFLKADDDTFILYPHLIELLAEFDHRSPVFLGFPLVYTDESSSLRVDYMSGGAGYVLSSPAVRMLQKTSIPECNFPGVTAYEDVNMGTCMNALGIRVEDTRDSLGRPRFLPYPPWTVMREDLEDHPNYLWLQRMSKFPFKFGVEHMSDRVVTFHEVRDPRDVYTLQYLTHDLRVLPEGTSVPFKIPDP